MNRIAERFTFLRENNRKALIPYVMGGFPNLKATAKSLEVFTKAGADLIEVGVPFSDPLADGPVIQTAGQQALQNGCTLPKLLKELEPVVSDLPVPIILMIYYNMIFLRGIRRFMEDVKESGCSGLIIPDLPPEEGDELRQIGEELELGLNFLVAPTSTKERIEIASKSSTGFVYAVSLKGVTGARKNLPVELPHFVSKIREITTKPVAVGFGISNSSQAREVSRYADGIIVGSAIVKTIAEDPQSHSAEYLVRELRSSIDK